MSNGETSFNQVIIRLTQRIQQFRRDINSATSQQELEELMTESGAIWNEILNAQNENQLVVTQAIQFHNIRAAFISHQNELGRRIISEIQ